MEVQQEISAEIFQSKVGREIDVIVDEIDAENEEAIARSPWDAPEIDGLVRVYPDPNSRHPVTVETGQFCVADIVDSHEYDLEAVYVSNQ